LQFKIGFRQANELYFVFRKSAFRKLKVYFQPSARILFFARVSIPETLSAQNFFETADFFGLFI
jgi:hypothetical protein